MIGSRGTKGNEIPYDSLFMDQARFTLPTHPEIRESNEKRSLFWLETQLEEESGWPKAAQGPRFTRSSSSRSAKGLLQVGSDPEIRYLSWKAAPHVRPYPSGFLSSVKRTHAHPVVTSGSWKNFGFNDIGGKTSLL